MLVASCLLALLGSRKLMAVWWEPTQDEFAERNGESPFVAPDFLETSNFQHLYKARGPRVSCK